MQYKVPYGINVSVEIVAGEDDSKEVIVHCPCYKKKRFKMKHSYSHLYTNAEILRDSDFHRVMINHFPKDK